MIRPNFDATQFIDFPSLVFHDQPGHHPCCSRSTSTSHLRIPLLHVLYPSHDSSFSSSVDGVPVCGIYVSFCILRCMVNPSLIIDYPWSRLRRAMLVDSQTIFWTLVGGPASSRRN